MPHPFPLARPGDLPDPAAAGFAPAGADEPDLRPDAPPPHVYPVPLTGDARIDGLLGRLMWTGGYVTYADTTSPEDYPEAEAGHAWVAGMSQIAAAQLAVVHAALNAADLGQPAGGIGNSVEGFTNLAIGYAGPGEADATIRIANTRALPRGDAATILLGVDPAAGDVFLGLGLTAPRAGNLAYHVTLHELGHALGLTHGHDSYAFGRLPAEWDSSEFSVMTYRSAVGGGFFTAEAWGHAQTFMMLDIAALQLLYGADFETNAGDTVYSWNPATGESYVDGAVSITPGANRILQTLWDGGGTDLYDLSNYATNLAIDLAPGGHSTFSAAQRAHLGGGPTGGHARGNVFNALQYRDDPRSLIENARGGAGDDVISGNAAANRLEGGAGADRLFGGAGDDALEGGAGADRLFGGAGNDVLDGGAGADVMDGGAGADLYLVDHARDVAAETAEGGGDMVQARVDYRLGAGVENLTLAGAAREGRGNALDNLMRGNELANLLVGGEGRDILRGMNGDDVLRGGRGVDDLRGGRGADRFDFNQSDLVGMRSHDVIRGGDGAAAIEGVGAPGGDLIDLGGIDANLDRDGDQAFVWNSTGVGGLSVIEMAGGVTRVRGNLSDAEGFELRIDIHDGAGVVAGDYVRGDFVL